MSVMAEALMAHPQHREELINKAVAVCLTFKEFAGCANLVSDAQSKIEPISTGSAVQNSGAQ